MANDYLVHHGILGMRWGVRRYQNKDGTLTAEGRRHLGRTEKKIREVYANAKYNQDISDEVFKLTGADKKILDNAKKELKKGADQYKEIDKECNKLFGKDYKNNKTEYEVISELADSTFGDVKNMSMEEVAWMAYMAVYEDGQQGRCNSYSLYANNKNILDKVNKLDTRSTEIYESMSDSIKQYINTAFKDVGLDELTVNDKSSYKMGSAVVNQMLNSVDDLSTYKLSMADNKLDDQILKNAKEASNLIRNIKNYNEDSTWWYFNTAVDKLDLNGKKASELSDSDWDRINKEIASLKK